MYAIGANNLQGLPFNYHHLYATFRERKAALLWAIKSLFIALTELSNGTQPRDLAHVVHKRRFLIWSVYFLALSCEQKRGQFVYGVHVYY